MFKKLKDFIVFILLSRRCRNLSVSPKGEAFLRYLEDVCSGKEGIYIEAYEETLNQKMEEDKCSRKEAAEFYLDIFAMVKGCHK